MMKRRAFLKTIAAGAVAAVVPLPAPCRYYAGESVGRETWVKPPKTYTIERYYKDFNTKITICGVPEQIIRGMLQGKADPTPQSWWDLEPGFYDYDVLKNWRNNDTRTN